MSSHDIDYRPIFNSAADIVSGTYPIPSCLSSVRPHQLFFKSDKLPQFSSDLSDIWYECAQ